ncbi:L-seryl-tRNA(Sec) kinase [Anomalospiza imberbis]|uniref:L-seryl-tRNA(Sec) kinase n=1 Tax=Anomalospiza imberbis TaxID=187417 RepID=UPI00358E9A29
MRTAPAEAAEPAALAAAEQRQRQRRGSGGARVALCLLCGLPAAGKSSLARALSRRLPQRPGWACALLAYDELIPPEAFRPREPSPLLAGWKQSRRELLQCLEGLLRALLTGAPLPGPAQPGWQRFQGCCRREGLLPAAEGDAGAASRPLVLLLDDNFYYQSMRYEVYQLARKYSLGFCQLFLECPVECCLQRNRLRSDPVPEQTIQLMARKIEMPDLRKNTWEQHSLILSSSDCISEDDEQIMNLLATALENPERPNEEDTEQKEAARAICAASAVHRADQACRRVISEAMQDAKGKSVLPSEMKSLAEELNKLKAEFLEDLRQGKTVKTQYSDPATSVISSFQHEAINVVNKYILK